MQYLSADLIFTENHILERDQVLIIEEDGSIVDVAQRDHVQSPDIQEYRGILVPGFVNTHCHLELSDMYQKIPQHTGLVTFIEKVNQYKFDKKEIAIEIMQKADQTMYEAGIAAVADISNTSDTIQVKKKSKINYHTLVEIMGVDGHLAMQRWQNGKKIFQDFVLHDLDASITLHAPYSCSIELFHMLAECDECGHLFSIHNLECLDERSLYSPEANTLKDFLKKYIQTDYMLPVWNRDTMPFYTQFLDDSKNSLFVHNTYMQPQDLTALKLEHAYLCTCPNANLYIENKLPDYTTWMDSKYKITIGTDSLASNQNLSIWDELKTIMRHTDIPLHTLLLWATLHGAEYMQLQEQLGSFTKGKKPGVVLLNGDIQEPQQLQPKRLF